MEEEEWKFSFSNLECYNLHMNFLFQIVSLTKDRFNEAVAVVLKAKLDTREEIEHHLQIFEAHFVALVDSKVIGVIGWYQDNVHYADLAMGDKFPGEEAYWVGFFSVEKDFQGKGVGTALLQRLEEAVKERKAGSLWVSSVPETRSYYEAKGFKLVLEGEINGRQKFFMAKKLV